ncbi:MAG: peptidoglycan DD-metalloendopeptidase family protein, partial [Clostridia bacterium]|nr:peptidoglycan DD-metalloendopeptidase family protein [Clostridia bacterium]
FRASGLSAPDAAFNALYVRATRKSVARAEERMRREGREITEEEKNAVHPFGLRLLSAAPRFFRRLFGALTGVFHSLVRRDRGGSGYKKSYAYFRRHVPHLIVGVGAVAAAFWAYWILSAPVVLEAEIDGRSIGAVENNAVVDTAKRELEDNVSGILGRAFQFPFEIRYTFVRSRSAEIVEKAGISEILYSFLPDYITTASGLYVDDTLVAVCSNAADIRAELDDITADRVGTAGDVGIFNDVLIINQAYPADSVISRGALRSLLEEMTVSPDQRGEESESPVRDNADPVDSSARSDRALLTDMEIPSVHVKKHTSNQPQGIRGIHLTFYRAETLRYQETVPFVTEYTESASLYTSMADVTTVGVNGKNNVEARVYYVDGVEARRDILSETVAVAPVNQVVTMGTRVLPEELGITGITGRFIKPKEVYVASGFGEREDGMHRGWDLLGREGENIYAAASGTVVTAIGPKGGFTYTAGAFYTGYGYCIVIEHEDGYSTLYGHCSDICVELGQEVKQGEKIGEIGMTGQASGNHVHFEIRHGNTRLNPANGFMYEGTTTIYDLRNNAVPAVTASSEETKKIQ